MIRPVGLLVAGFVAGTVFAGFAAPSPEPFTREGPAARGSLTPDDTPISPPVDGGEPYDVWPPPSEDPQDPAVAEVEDPDSRREELASRDPDGWRSWRSHWYHRHHSDQAAFRRLHCQPERVFVADALHLRCGGLWLARAFVDGAFGYGVVGAPEGYVTHALDGPCEPVRLDTTAYCYLDGVFYVTVVRGTARPHQVVAAPVGARVSSVPDATVFISHRGVEYLQFDRTFFDEDPAGGGPRYRVVDNPFLPSDRG